MLRISCSALAVVLVIGGLSAGLVQAQSPVPGLEPHVDLTSSLDAGPEQAGFNGMPARLHVDMSALEVTTDDDLFNDPAPLEGGWKGLARILEALSPNVDTDIPLTGSQITTRISAMLDQGQNQQALEIILKRNAQLQEQGAMGTDVQLLFLHARALAALDRQNEAIAIYQQMTTLYPELPEPWNNLAAEYVKQGKFNLAHDALSMALTANPNYATARANLGDVQLMLARESFQDAARLGFSSAQTKAQQAADLLK